MGRNWGRIILSRVPAPREESCSYCTHPQLRGRSRQRDTPQLKRHASLNRYPHGKRIAGRRLGRLDRAAGRRNMGTDSTRTTAEKVELFQRLFTGLLNVYGTYDLRTGRVRQVKQPVTERVILAHLQGRRSYGVYLLVKDRTCAIAVDFDSDDLLGPMEFVKAAKDCRLPTYIERSKSKGYHTWIFFGQRSVSAAKARLVVRHILAEIEQPAIEVFPKQDSLDTNLMYGNFINAPLFGALVPKGRTVFLDPTDPTRPHADQWAFLDGVECVPERLLDEIIEINELGVPAGPVVSEGVNPNNSQRSFGLPLCAQRMLADGVTANQRVSCFRLAVNLKRVGLPLDMAVAVLEAWARRNRPTDGKRIITGTEISSQVTSAYDRGYRGCGCDDPAVSPYCDPSCPLQKRCPPRPAPKSESSHPSRTSAAHTQPGS